MATKCTRLWKENALRPGDRYKTGEVKTAGDELAHAEDVGDAMPGGIALTLRG